MSCYATVGGLSIGDCGAKTTNVIDTTSITKSITNSVQSKRDSSTNTSIANQNQRIVIDGMGPGCCQNFNASQTMRFKSVSKSDINDQFVTNIKASVTDKIDSAISAAMSSSTSLLARDTSKLSNSVKAYIEKQFQRESVKNSIKEKANNTIASQNQEITIKCADLWNRETGQYIKPIKPSNCDINQDFVAEAFSSDVSKTIFKDIVNDSGVMDALNELKSKHEAKGEGFSDIIGSLTGIYAVIAIVVIAVVGIAAYFLLNGGGDKLIGLKKGLM
jgi:hypothetical protein